MQNLISIIETKEPIIETDKNKNLEKEPSIGARISIGFTDSSARSLNPHEKEISPKSTLFNFFCFFLIQICYNKIVYCLYSKI